MARTFTPLGKDEMESLRGRMNPWRQPMEKKLVGHLDGPTLTPEIFWA